MIIVDVLVLIIVYFFVFLRKWIKKGPVNFIINTLMYLYVSFVLYFTLMPIITSIPDIFNHTYQIMNIELFGDYFNGKGDAVRQIVLNVIMTIPFGFLMGIITKKNILWCILYTFIFSVCIELIQPLIHGTRTSDITDIVTNVIGGTIGYIFYFIFRPIINRIIIFSERKNF